MVVHAISLPPGEFGGPHVDAFFLGLLDVVAHPFFQEIATLKVSAHFVMDRLGAVTQYVPVAQRAWHAGKSMWEGRVNVNDFSIGIELEGDDKTPFTAAQYTNLATLIQTLRTRYPLLGEQRIVGHEHIAPGRKWDPGPFFDWSTLHSLLKPIQPVPPWPLIWEA